MFLIMLFIIIPLFHVYMHNTNNCKKISEPEIKTFWKLIADIYKPKEFEKWIIAPIKYIYDAIKKPTKLKIIVIFIYTLVIVLFISFVFLDIKNMIPSSFYINK